MAMEGALPDEGTMNSMLRSLLSFLAPASSQVAAALPVRLRSQSARAAADEVLAATDLEDLGERLDAFASDEEAWVAETEAWESSSASTSDAVAQVDAMKLDIASLTRVLGPTATRRCEQGHAAMKEGLRRLLRVVSALEAKEKPTSEDASKLVRTPTAAAYDITTPPTLRRLIVDFMRLFAATTAIARAEELGKRLEPWLALGLASAWAEGPERLAATLASSEKVVAWFMQIISEGPAARATETLLSQWRIEAEASGMGVFFPVDGSDREAH